MEIVTVLWVMFAVLVGLISMLVAALVYDAKTGLGEKWVMRVVWLFAPWLVITVVAVLFL